VAVFSVGQRRHHGALTGWGPAMGVLDGDPCRGRRCVYGVDRSPSLGTAAPAGVLFGEGDLPSRSSMSQAIFNTASLGDEGV
jgi:hypothetical protein